MFTLITLKYKPRDLEPIMSEETIMYHYGKHHNAYVNKLNELIAGTDYEKMTLEEIILATKAGPIFNNAAQNWNHIIFWNQFIPGGNSAVGTKTYDLIIENFGSFDNFKSEFIKSATTIFGSGWTWLVVDEQGKLKVVNSANGENPLSLGYSKTLMGFDVWEHSYYIDYRNDRAKYLDNLFSILDWKYVDSRLG